MDTQKIVTHFRYSGWGEAVKERMASGKTVSVFCEENGISKTTYYYRQRKVREAACAELREKQNCGTGLVPSGWEQLAEAESETVTTVEGTLTIEIGGCYIKATASTDPKLLAKVCRVLGAL